MEELEIVKAIVENAGETAKSVLILYYVKCISVNVLGWAGGLTLALIIIRALKSIIASNMKTTAVLREFDLRHFERHQFKVNDALNQIHQWKESDRART